MHEKKLAHNHIILHVDPIFAVKLFCYLAHFNAFGTLICQYTLRWKFIIPINSTCGDKVQTSIVKNKKRHLELENAQI